MVIVVLEKCACRLEKVLKRDKLNRFPIPLPRLAAWFKGGQVCTKRSSTLCRFDEVFERIHSAALLPASRLDQSAARCGE